MADQIQNGLAGLRQLTNFSHHLHSLSQSLSPQLQQGVPNGLVINLPAASLLLLYPAHLLLVTFYEVLRVLLLLLLLSLYF